MNSAIFTYATKIESGRLEFDIPIKTVSEANCTEHWKKKHKRHASQKSAVFLSLAKHRTKMKLPCALHLVRYAPMTLDKFENLPCSLKYIVDAACAVITGDYRPGRADSSDQITISCDQVKYRDYGVKIIITCQQ